MNKTSIKIILTTMLFAICYGIIHDLITAHLCVEYFTIGHPKILESQSPIILAITWGVIATWWLALPMGLLIASFNYFGKQSSLKYDEVLKLKKKLIIFMFCIAVIAGIIGFILSEFNFIYLIPRLANQMDSSKHSKFLAAGWAHASSYLSAVIGSFILCRIILIKRNLLKK